MAYFDNNQIDNMLFRYTSYFHLLPHLMYTDGFNFNYYYNNNNNNSNAINVYISCITGMLLNLLILAQLNKVINR